MAKPFVKANTWLSWTESFADSIPAKEHEETLNKAKGLLRALEVAEKQL
jgi:hypothetical protein